MGLGLGLQCLRSNFCSTILPNPCQVVGVDALTLIHRQSRVRSPVSQGRLQKFWSGKIPQNNKKKLNTNTALAKRLDSQVMASAPSTNMETPGAMVGKPFMIFTAGEFVKGINVAAGAMVGVCAGISPALVS